MFIGLMLSRRFWPLFWCQFFSAFNDNFVRNMLAMLILFRLGEENSGALVTLAVAIFVLPSIVLSAPAGEIADASDKALIARRLKFAEIFVQMIAAAGFWLGSLTLLYVSLFGLGVIAALFGPIKYGILPDHLHTQELPAGNALVEGATFVAILLGIVIGGFAAAENRAPEGVVLQLGVIALACWLSSLAIPPTGIAAPKLRPDRNILRSTSRLLRELHGERDVLAAARAVAWFWMTGAVCLSLIPLLVKEQLGGGIATETLVNALFAIGIAIGSIGAAIVARGSIDLRPIPAAAAVMAIFLIDIGAAMAGRPPAASAQPVSEFISSAAGLRLSFDVLLIAIAGGFFIVPAFAAVQAWAGVERRARVVAATNILTALFMVGGSIATAILQTHFIGLGAAHLLIALGLLNLLAGFYFLLAMPGVRSGRLATRLMDLLPPALRSRRPPPP